MDAPDSATAAPRRLLLATDLTSRCDRALDRAVALADAWGAALHVVHAVQAQPPDVPAGVDPDLFLARYPDPRAEAAAKLRRDLRPDEAGATVHLVDVGTPADAILDVAAHEGCDLIVLGESRPRLLALESTGEAVVRKATASVLVVRDRTHGPYRDVLVGTDFSDEAQQALEAAAGLFPHARITLMHVDAMPYAYLLEGTPEGRDWPARQRARLREQVEAAALSPDRQAAIHDAVEAGPPAVMLRRHVLANDIDLTVIGAYPRGMLFDAVVGNSRRIVDAIPGDVLIVRARA